MKLMKEINLKLLNNLVKCMGILLTKYTSINKRAVIRLIIFVAIINIGLTALASPTAMDNMSDRTLTLKEGVLTGQVSVGKELPKELYGSWSVSAELIDSNNPYLYNSHSSDVWTLQKNQNQVTLTNPKSGAVASISVESVHGNNAVFIRRQEDATTRDVEKVEITLDGNVFYGTDTLVTGHYSRGQLVKTEVVKYRIFAKRLSGSALKEIFSKE